MSDEKPNKSLVNITRVDVKPVVVQLTRIADALEIIVREQYHYNMRPPVTDRSGPPPTVDYSDDLATTRQELADLVKSVEPSETPEGGYEEET